MSSSASARRRAGGWPWPSAALGALWVIFRADLDALLAFEIGRGEILFVGGTTLHALYPVAIRKLHRGEDLATFTFGSIAMGTAILAAIGARDITITAWDTLPWIFWIVIAYLGFLCHGRDVPSRPVRHHPPALGQGHGLPLSDAEFHHRLGDPCAGNPCPKPSSSPASP